MVSIEQFLVDAGEQPWYVIMVFRFLRFLVSLVILYVVGRRLLLPLLDRAMDVRGYDRAVQRPLMKVAWWVIFFGVVAISVAVAGYGNILLSLTAIAAAATLAIGFAMQDLLKNLVAGIFIIIEKPFRIDDWIEWDGNAGIVEDISLRVTRVRTFDNELLTVPNAILAQDVVKNPVANDTLRVKVTFGIGYDDDIDTATEIILDEADKHPDILDDPSPSVRLTDLGDSSVDLQSRIWIANPSRSDFVKTKGEYVNAVKDRFDAEGINIPYPTRDLVGGLQLSGQLQSSPVPDSTD